MSTVDVNWELRPSACEFVFPYECYKPSDSASASSVSTYLSKPVSSFKVLYPFFFLYTIKSPEVVVFSFWKCLVF